MVIFLADFVAELYVEQKYGIEGEQNVEKSITGQEKNESATIMDQRRTSTSIMARARSVTDAGNDDLDGTTANKDVQLLAERRYEKRFAEFQDVSSDEDEQARQFAVQQQLAAFLILEFGVIFHSVIIGLNLGVAGSEFSTLYVVLVFHQSFEGLGIGARMSAIPFKKHSWVPWILCSLYGITTPLSIAIGIGLRTTYNSGSYTANVVSGVLDSMSAGILIYTGLVELLARDFPVQSHANKRQQEASFYGRLCFSWSRRIMALVGEVGVNEKLVAEVQAS